jgi:hypothetical protein
MYPQMDAIDPEPDLFGDFDRQHLIDGCDEIGEGSSVCV